MADADVNLHEYVHILTSRNLTSSNARYLRYLARLVRTRAYSSERKHQNQDGHMTIMSNYGTVFFWIFSTDYMLRWARSAWAGYRPACAHVPFPFCPTKIEALARCWTQPIKSSRGLVGSATLRGVDRDPDIATAAALLQCYNSSRYRTAVSVQQKVFFEVRTSTFRSTYVQQYEIFKAERYFLFQ